MPLDKKEYVLPTIVSDSIGSGVRVGGSGQSDLLIGGVIDGVEALQECVTVDEIKTLTTGGTKIANNQVDTASGATDLCVKRAGPQLGVWGKSVRTTIRSEDQILQLCELGRSDAKKTSGGVGDGTSGRLVPVESVGGKQDQGCPSVNNTCRRSKDGRWTVVDGLVDPPVGASRVGVGDGRKIDLTRIFGTISSTPSNLPISRRGWGKWLEEDTNLVSGDGAKVV